MKYGTLEFNPLKILCFFNPNVGKTYSFAFGILTRINILTDWENLRLLCCDLKIHNGAHKFKAHKNLHRCRTEQTFTNFNQTPDSKLFFREIYQLQGYSFQAWKHFQIWAPCSFVSNS